MVNSDNSIEWKFAQQISDPSRLRHYFRLLGKRCPPAKAFELATGPYAGHSDLALDTDTAFMAGRGDGFLDDDFGRRQAYAKAKREGLNIQGKFWSPSLNAWVGSKAEVKAICRKKGWGCQGAVKEPLPINNSPPIREGKYQCAESCVQREVKRIVKTEMGGRISNREHEDLTDKTRKRLSGEL